MTNAIEMLAQDEADIGAARDAILSVLGEKDGYRATYAALCRWTWRATIERRLDDDLRAWHRLLLDTAARIGTSPVTRRTDPGKLMPVETAQRLRALADIVRLSIDAAKVAEGTDFTGRAHVMEIIRLLVAKTGEFVLREAIKVELGLGNANLSRVLSLLVLNGLVEREPRERKAAFRATQRAIRIVEQADVRAGKAAAPPPPPPPAIIAGNPSDKGPTYFGVFVDDAPGDPLPGLKPIKVNAPRFKINDASRAYIYIPQQISKQPVIDLDHDPIAPHIAAFAGAGLPS